MIFYIIVFAVSFVLLAKSSDMLVRSLTFFGRFFSLSEYAISFIFMSVATSVPELFIGLSSAFKGISQFSLGNVLGASLIDITLVIGLVVFLGKGLRVDSKISRRNFWLISLLPVLLILLSTDGTLSRGDGLILLLAFVVYVWRLKREEDYFSKTINRLPTERTFTAFKQSFRFLVALLFLIASSYLIVWSGKNLAASSSLGLLSFGLIFAALGTTVPEMAFGIRARSLGHDSMTIGNSFGSVAFNTTLIIGIVSIINPISVAVSKNLIVVVAALLLSILFFNIFIFSRDKISRMEGLILVLIYVLFLLFEMGEYFTGLF